MCGLGELQYLVCACQLCPPLSWKSHLYPSLPRWNFQAPRFFYLLMAMADCCQPFFSPPLLLISLSFKMTILSFLVGGILICFCFFKLKGWMAIFIYFCGKNGWQGFVMWKLKRERIARRWFWKGWDILNFKYVTFVLYFSMINSWILLYTLNFLQKHCGQAGVGLFAGNRLVRITMFCQRCDFWWGSWCYIIVPTFLESFQCISIWILSSVGVARVCYLIFEMEETENNLWMEKKMCAK